MRLSTIPNLIELKKAIAGITIGAGLSGLMLAYELEKKGIPSLVLEASARTGGRIHTEKGANGTRSKNSISLHLVFQFFKQGHLSPTEICYTGI